jgi:hypothetical protein
VVHEHASAATSSSEHRKPPLAPLSTPSISEPTRAVGAAAVPIRCPDDNFEGYVLVEEEAREARRAAGAMVA